MWARDCQSWRRPWAFTATALDFKMVAIEEWRNQEMSEGQRSGQYWEGGDSPVSLPYCYMSFGGYMVPGHVCLLLCVLTGDGVDDSLCHCCLYFCCHNRTKSECHTPKIRDWLWTSGVLSSSKNISRCFIYFRRFQDWALVYVWILQVDN